MLYLSEWFLILALYASAIVLMLILLRLAHRQSQQAASLGLVLMTFWLAYLLVGTLVAVLTPRRILVEGQPRFFDETGVTAISLEPTPTFSTERGSLQAHGIFYLVTERTFNRSARVPHRAPALDVLLQDAAGNLYRPDRAATDLLPGSRGLQSNPLLAPGESRTRELAFDVPVGTHRPGLLIRHRDRHTLNRILLGDPEHFWHRDTVVLLDK